MADNFDRIIPLTNVHNFRDYGGYATGDGGRIVTAKLFRSAQHYEATADDLAAIAELNLAAVIDLRGASERRKAPCPRPANFAAEVIFIDDETVSMAPHIAAARESLDPERMVQVMVAGYSKMPFQPVLAQVLRRYFAALDTHDGATLIHCMAGKDRTGLAVALLHHLLGVHHDDMIADYLLTNTAGDIEARVAAGARHLSAVSKDKASEAAVRVLMMVQPEYLDAGFAAMAERHGSVDAYLRDFLDVSDARKARIKAKLII